ncbi:hypothetical protein ACKWTF_003518 [Chironomus riparius]
MNSVLSPELMWIGSRCYRVNIPNDRRNEPERVNINYEEEEFNCELDAEDLYDEIEPIDNGTKFQLKMHIPSLFYSQIIGTKGATKKRLEQETSTQLTVPKMGSRDSNVLIIGKSRKDIISMRNRLDLIVVSGRAKQNFTHFLSIAFTSSQIQENFNKFKSQILNDPEIYGIDDSLFQKPQKLHLTIGTLSLLDNEDRSRTAEMQQDCKEFIIDQVLQGSELNAKMVGLDYMNDDPSAVDVLYAKVVSENLQEISNGIAEYFSSRGFMQLKGDQVKLHVTLINSLFRDNDDAIVKDENQPRDSRDKDQGNRIKFDASKILKKYKDFNFGEIKIKEIHLSQRYSKASNGFYEATGILKL